MHKEVMLKSKKLWVRAGLAVQRAGRSWSWGLAASLDLGLGGSTEGKGKEEPPRQSVLLGKPKPCWDKPSAQPTLPTGFYILPERRQALLPQEHRPEGKEDGEAGACTSPVPPGKCWRPCWAVLGVSSKPRAGAGSVPWVAGSWLPRRPAFLRAGKPSHASCGVPGAPPPRAAPAAPLDAALEHSLSCSLGQEQSDARRLWSSARV